MFNRFYYRGFQPTTALEADTEEMLNVLKTGGPSDATFLGSVEAVPEGYLARLDLYSIHGPFLADAGSPDAKLAVQAVIEKIREQVERWRGTRSSRELSSIRDPYFLPPSLDS